MSGFNYAYVVHSDHQLTSRSPGCENVPELSQLQLQLQLQST